jgi:7,8-dihydro-6-hydroxymethylpterin-pyrophosphokinase (HPPK)
MSKSALRSISTSRSLTRNLSLSKSILYCPSISASGRCQSNASSTIRTPSWYRKALELRRQDQRIGERHYAKAAGLVVCRETSPDATPSVSNPKNSGAGTPYGTRDTTMHRAMIALGSNIGDRVNMIEQACEMMASRGLHVKATSCLYETAPMYVTDQEPFLNGVCEVRKNSIVLSRQ